MVYIDTVTAIYAADVSVFLVFAKACLPSYVKEINISDCCLVRHY